MTAGGAGDKEAGASLVVLLSGPNLDLLGERQPEVYGTRTLADHVAAASEEAARHGLALEHVQSNHEGELVEAVHRARGRAAALIVNAGALTHYSWSLHDALAAFEGPVVELHLSNPGAREQWRHRSVVTPVATGVIAGFGQVGYRLAVEAVAALLAAGRSEAAAKEATAAAAAPAGATAPGTAAAAPGAPGMAEEGP